MAAIPQQIYADITTQKRTVTNPDGSVTEVVYNHMIFGMAVFNGVTQTLDKDALYTWEGTLDTGEVMTSKTPAVLGISESGSTVGREIVPKNPLPGQWINWKLWLMPPA